jgi:hypothetical protein
VESKSGLVASSGCLFLCGEAADVVPFAVVLDTRPPPAGGKEVDALISGRSSGPDDVAGVLVLLARPQIGSAVVEAIMVDVVDLAVWIGEHVDDAAPDTAVSGETNDIPVRPDSPVPRRQHLVVLVVDESDLALSQRDRLHRVTSPTMPSTTAARAASADRTGRSWIASTAKMTSATVAQVRTLA